MNKSQEQVSFKDICVDFTLEEWYLLDPAQKILHRDVMLENYSHLVSIGCCITKPEVIIKIEQGEEPWILEQGFPSQCHPEEWNVEDLIESSQENQDENFWLLTLLNLHGDCIMVCYYTFLPNSPLSAIMLVDIA